MTQILMIIQQDMLLFLCIMLFVLFAVSNALIKYQLAVKGYPKGFRSAVINMVAYDLSLILCNLRYFTKVS